MLKNELKEIIGKFDADIAVLVKDFRTNELLFNYNEKKIYPSASVIKILIMVEALSRAYNLEIPLLSKIEIKASDKVKFSVITEQNLSECTYLDLITWMIISSDNTAANVLIDVLNMNSINNTISNLNMKNTKLQRKMMENGEINEFQDNFTTLEDTLIIMEGLYKGEIINKEISQKAIDIMKNQRDNSMLKRYICDNVTLANKTGQLSHLCNDVGIFYTKASDYFIGIFVNNEKDNEEACKIIGSLSKKVYDYLIDNI